MGILDFLFGNKSEKIQDFKERGAVILDVRTKNEYEQGAIPRSKHIPLQQLQSHLNKVKGWNKPVVTCCASGVRSGSAAALLRNNGVEAMNGGGWMSLHKKWEA
ncbi:rhodanese-like domain-containing protein [Altibacter sp. HG106]|uniref:rhodanese-like domain-containing protein n=1 Tax=Altibacter sp. HG106 TaxID=3023937 RepID=UPI002350BC01|nr:rhodanese-like domain-containing protein [Altibacter sp. HG106]MDC7994553.1 rhodanese-like domain-containing protein [Altibacter sp. HG106]